MTVYVWRYLSVVPALVLAWSLSLAASPCDMDVLKRIEAKLEDLSSSEVADFFQTLHEGCAGNVEFSEWSNELLFALLAKQPLVVLEMLEKQPYEKARLVTSMLESPVHDSIDLQAVYVAVTGAKTTSAMKAKVLSALQVAAGKYGATLN